MIPKNIGAIVEQDLQQLVDNAVAEKKTIEYKAVLPGNTDSEKKEFLADVSSFANSSGGDLIYGISEDKDTGNPKELIGLEIVNVSDEILRLENITRDGIAPRIHGLAPQSITLSNSRIAIVIRIPKSWQSPHRVVFCHHDKFYARGTNGKYQMDVGELRVAFNLSETLAEKIRRFREDRIAKIVAEETPVLLDGKARLILHLIPMISFAPGQSYDMTKVRSNVGNVIPISGSGGFHNRYNIDGHLMFFAEDGEGISTCSYVQVFKNGIVEATDSLLLSSAEKPLIPNRQFETRLVQALGRYMSVLEMLEVDLPFLGFLSMVGVKGYTMDHSTVLPGLPAKIDRDILLPPEVLIDSYTHKPEQVLKPCFDSIWNACGFSRSLNYDKDGRWRLDLDCD